VFSKHETLLELLTTRVECMQITEQHESLGRERDSDSGVENEMSWLVSRDIVPVPCHES
jgi:hypothetical protein